MVEKIFHLGLYSIPYKSLLKYIYLIIVSLFLSVSCSSDIGGKPIYFIGDSLVERWDLQSYFSSDITYNLVGVALI